MDAFADFDDPGGGNEEHGITREVVHGTNGTTFRETRTVRREARPTRHTLRDMSQQPGTVVTSDALTMDDVPPAVLTAQGCLPEGLLDILRGVAMLSASFGDDRVILCGDDDDEEASDDVDDATDDASSDGHVGGDVDDNHSVTDAASHVSTSSSCCTPPDDRLTRSELESISFRSSDSAVYRYTHMALARRAAGMWCAGCSLTGANDGDGDSLMNRIEDTLTTKLPQRGIVASVRLARELYDRISFPHGQKRRWRIWSIFFHVYDHLQGHRVVSPVLRMIEFQSLYRQIILNDACKRDPRQGPGTFVDYRMLRAAIDTGRMIGQLEEKVAAAAGSASVRIGGTAATASAGKKIVRQTATSRKRPREGADKGGDTDSVADESVIDWE